MMPSWTLSLVIARGLDGGAPQNWEALADATLDPLPSEPLLDCLPLPFEEAAAYSSPALSLWLEPLSLRALIAWQAQKPSDSDPFESWDEALPAQLLLAVHMDPQSGEYGLLLAEDGTLKRRLFVALTDQATIVNEGPIAPLEQAHWDALDLAPQRLASQLPSLTPETAGFALESLCLKLLAEKADFDITDPDHAIWQLEMQRFMLD